MSPDFKKWQCFFCGYIYDEAMGDEQEGIAPGTRWEDLPADWVCPSCGAQKSDFAMMEIA
jgi:rubredoxin